MTNNLEKLLDNKVFLTFLSLGGTTTLYISVVIGFYLLMKVFFWGQGAVLFNIPI